MKRLIKNLLVGKSSLAQRITDAFHIQWYHSPDSWNQNTFLGVPILQCPLDLQLYQEIIFRTRPNFILQTGVWKGGSILYFASMLDLIGAPPSTLAIGIDVELSETARKIEHPRVRLIEGSSVAEDVLQQVRTLVHGGRGMVVLDSDHSQRHVATELRAYNDFVDVGSYLVVEDTNVNGHPVYPSHGPGPREAVDEFLSQDKRFKPDDELWLRNRFSFHQGGWLRRVAE